MKRLSLFALLCPLFVHAAEEVFVVPTNYDAAMIVLSDELHAKRPDLCVGQISPKTAGRLGLLARVEHIVLWSNPAGCVPQALAATEVQFFFLKRFFNEAPIAAYQEWHDVFGLDPEVTKSQIAELPMPFQFRGNRYDKLKTVKGYLFDRSGVRGQMTADFKCVSENPHREALIGSGMRPEQVPMLCDNAGEFPKWVINQLDAVQSTNSARL